MSRRLLESYLRQSAKFDSAGNLVMNPGTDFTAEDENLPVRYKKHVRDPEVVTEEEVKQQRDQRIIEMSGEYFRDAETGAKHKASGLTPGRLYLTKDSRAFVFHDGKMEFYSKVVPVAEMESHGLKKLLAHNLPLWDGEYTMVVAMGDSEIPTVLGVKLLGSENSPVVSFIVKPANFRRKPLVANFAAKVGGVLIELISAESGHRFVGIFNENHLRIDTVDGEKRYEYSGVLWPLQPPKEMTVDVSHVEKVIGLADYLRQTMT